MKRSQENGVRRVDGVSREPVERHEELERRENGMVREDDAQQANGVPREDGVPRENGVPEEQGVRRQDGVPEEEGARRENGAPEEQGARREDGVRGGDGVRRTGWREDRLEVAADRVVRRGTRVVVVLVSVLAATLTAMMAGGSADANVTGNPVTMTSGFYVDPNSNPAVWVRDHPSDPDATAIRTKIAEQAGGRWFGNWSGNIQQAVSAYTTAADNADKLPILVAYNIPGRDCGGDSSGGAGSPEAYQTWISQFADGIGDRPAIVIIEPDALAQLGCIPANVQQTRLDLLKYAVNQFATKNPNTWAYMDGGNATWIEAGEMARRLQAVEVGKIRGFALNTSNYKTTSDSVAKGNAIRGALNSPAQFVIDTSRNGNGPDGDSWCNPPGRKLGDTSRDGSHISGTLDSLLWIKVPGDSDGNCGLGTGIPAGTFSPTLAKHLITGT